MKIKSRKAELKQRDKVSLAKYDGMLCNDRSYVIRFIFTNKKPSISRIPKNQSIQNTPSRRSNFSFSFEGVSNLNCF